MENVLIGIQKDPSPQNSHLPKQSFYTKENDVLKHLISKAVQEFELKAREEENYYANRS